MRPARPTCRGTQHLHKPAIIGRFGDKNVIAPVWISDELLAPEPWSRWLKRAAAA
jgi:urea transport system substrate-binding protein